MKYFCFAFLSLIFINPLFAQDTSETINSELKHGVQFQIGSLLDLQNYKGYTFSYRYRFTNNSGIRVSFSPALQEEDSDLRQQVDSVSINPPYYRNFYNYKLSVQYLHCIAWYSNFSLFLGGGPFYSYSKGDSYYESLGSNNLRKYKEYDLTTSYGVELLAGIEYQLFTNVILSGEYGLAISKANTEFEYESIDEFEDQSQTYKQKGTRDRFFINSTGATLGIAVFF